MSTFFGYLVLTPKYDYLNELNNYITRYIGSEFSGNIFNPNVSCIAGNYLSSDLQTNLSIETLLNSPTLESSNYILVSDTNSEIEPNVMGLGIPTRNSYISSALNGSILNKEQLVEELALNKDICDYLLPAKMLTKLNQLTETETDKSSDKLSYRDIILNKIYSRLNGDYNLHIAYISNKPSFILMDKGDTSISIGEDVYKGIYVWYIYYKGISALLWSNNRNLLDGFDDFISVNYRNNSYFLFSCHLLTIKSGLLVLYPTYLVSKLVKWRDTYKQKGGMLLTIANLKTYLKKITINPNKDK